MLVWDSEEARQVACCMAGDIQYGNGRRVKEDLCLSIVKGNAVDKVDEAMSWPGRL
jgi:hypothetical protein